eukprot:TRINITY_DN15230_c0_g1_i1.p1 TRINITY_DN15230_c0_g1~~TRINITY_DN15230_c0_g1_i1.p1  ORF type:complete len:333 (+),score=59.28 TRINITY_DN15230_c0_g1_i1:84-1082(+)
MEKFGRFNDKFTGINPFTPISGQVSRLSLGKLVKGLFGFILFLVRFPILITGFILLFISHVLASVLTLVLLKRVWLRTVDAGIARFILMVLGFWNIPFKLGTNKFGRGIHKRMHTYRKVKSDEIIVTNRTSFVEVLYLAFKFSPEFTNCYSKDSAQIKHISIFSALCNSISGMDPFLKNGKKVTACHSRNFLRGPIVISPECCNTNGSAVLKFEPVLESEEIVEVFKKKTHVLAFSYPNKSNSSCHPIGSFMGLIYRLTSRLSTSVSVTFLPAECVPSSESSKQWSKELRQVIACFANPVEGVRCCVDIGVEDYKEFVQDWKQDRSSSRDRD